MKEVPILSVLLPTECINTTAYGFLLLLACWFIKTPKIRVLGCVSKVTCTHKVFQHPFTHEPLSCILIPFCKFLLLKLPIQTLCCCSAHLALATLTPNRCPERRHEQCCWDDTEPPPLQFPLENFRLSRSLTFVRLRSGDQKPPVY